MEIGTLVENWSRNAGTLAQAGKSRNTRVLLSLAKPAFRGFILRNGRAPEGSEVTATHNAFFDWGYERNQPKLASLYSAAKRSQWDGERDLDWSITVDPYDSSRELVTDEGLPLNAIPQYRRLSARERQTHRHGLIAWMLSQFLHGEQGALLAACQVTEAVHWMDGKLYGSTQVVDEGRHVEVFHRYITQKLEKFYDINDNLYVIVDALMSDSRWDIKFLGMQIMIEGLALGAFGTLRMQTKEPLLKELLKYVITDEARHVHYGVVSLATYYTEGLPENERKEREDWAYEMSLLMRSRFLAHEFFDEFYGHALKRSEWERYVMESDYMRFFQKNLFRRVIPNLKRIGLLSPRIRPHYAALGLLQWENDKPAPELSAEDLLSE
jgi:hypothetical protein